MNTNPSKPAHHRFRGSPLDKALGAALALVCIAVPPFVYGHIGIIYALIVLNGLLIFGLRETMAAERAQVEHARKDTTPFLELGSARGVFAGKPDPYAPDEGLPVGLSVGDLASHFIVFGSTCTGMTSSLSLNPTNRRGGRRGRLNKK